VNRDELFAELDMLTEREIEAGLAAGVWDEPKIPLVRHYLEQMKPGQATATRVDQLEIARNVRDAAWEAVGEAKGAKLLAIAALIIAAGAMIAAMASAFVAFLALRHWTVPW
jgi:hypothetical protein